MSARQMYSSSIKSPFPPSPPPALAAIPAGLCGGSGQMLGWAGSQLTLGCLSPCAAFLLGVSQPWDPSQST